jgi:NAD(P) transhydrogenase subunit alpha
MSVPIIVLLFVAATAAGYKTISSVPPLLHTPLMSGMNALSGITALGAFASVATASAFHSKILVSVAIAMAAVNIVGGFAVTHRMLRMFREKHSQD